MTLKELKTQWKKIVSGERPPIDMWHFIVGNVRYYLYYNKGIFNRDFIRPHILEQIKYRVRVMNPLCYSRGECVKCGCMTTALQMCNKSCDGLCYPRMLNKKEFRVFQKHGIIIHYLKNKEIWIWDNKLDKYILYKENQHSYVPENRS